MRSTMTAWRGGSSSGVPPSTASSAETPTSAPRWLTVSRKGPGKVFSRPTRSPTTFLPAISRPPFVLRREVGADHVLPVGPIVRPPGPDIQPDVDSFVPHEVAELDRVADVGVAFAGRHHLGRHRAQRTQQGLVVQAGQERKRIREVRAVVVIAIEPARGVEGAAHGDEAAHAGRMSQREQHRMQGAERRARRDRRVGDTCHDLVEDVGLVLNVARDALRRRRASRVPRFAVDAVDADHLEGAAVDPVRDGADETEVLPLVEAAHRGRKRKEGAPPAAEMQQLHVTPEGVAEFLVVLALHGARSVSARLWASAGPRSPKLRFPGMSAGTRAAGAAGGALGRGGRLQRCWALLHYEVDQAPLLGLLGGHEEVALHRALDVLQLPPAVLGVDARDLLALPQDLLRVDMD